LGAHFARVLHGAGASVALAARREAATAALATELGARAVSVPLDVTAPETIPLAFAAAEAAFGAPCDILVNNAGIAVTKPALQQSAEDWDSVLDVNLRGCFLVAQEAAKRLVAAKCPGVVVNIANHSRRGRLYRRQGRAFAHDAPFGGGMGAAWHSRECDCAWLYRH
jgi:NAD(P)-dependent dehydrogenase (short-subunit alcohol dehydrogenase family)